MIRLTQPVSGREVRVADEHADFWRGLGYRDSQPAAEEKPVKKATAKRTSRKAADK